jgi:hypothetical protein
MKTIKMLVEFTYDPGLMHGDDPEATEWFNKEILREDDLQLWSNDIGDDIGSIKVLEFL